MNDAHTIDAPHNDELFEPFERLISIEILGHKVKVPENNNLLRCFQFLSLNTISRSEFCWNRDCGKCLVTYCDDDDDTNKTALACRLRGRENLRVTKLDSHIEIEGITNTEQ
ncbi:MAG: hypothetical protein NVSMB56_16640 [Pyrinomonadaceae bacterium]